MLEVGLSPARNLCFELRHVGLLRLLQFTQLFLASLFAALLFLRVILRLDFSVVLGALEPVVNCLDSSLSDFGEDRRFVALHGFAD